MSYSISKLSTKCQNCPHKDDCRHKTMMMCAVAEYPTEKPLNIQTAQETIQPILLRDSEKEVMKLLHRNMMYGA